MLRANNEANEDIYIDNSKTGEKYHCPICDMPVFRKMGNGLRRPHFAHNNHGRGGASCDGWHYDMSDWHREWQERFPVDCREVIVAHDGKKHRADVLIEDHKLVVEFQHSRLSPEEYAERNQFYFNAGYRVIWLFDMSLDYKEGRIVYQSDSSKAAWKRPWSTFRTLNKSNGDDRNSRWNTNVDAVFFENGRLIAKLLGYSDKEKSLSISFMASNSSFSWSDYTFSMYLKDIFAELYLDAPECPRCHIPMRLRRHSATLDLFWGCQNYRSNNYVNAKDVTPSCTERRYFGTMLPPGLSTGCKCMYCGEGMYVNSDGIRCGNCGFEISYKYRDN